MQLSVVVPVFNEVDNVGRLTAEIDDALTARFDYEIIFVDDGSTDGTLEMLRVLRGEHRRLRVLRHRRNGGQSLALRNGVRAARSEWVATIDGDCQNDPADLLALIAARDRAARPPALIAGQRRRRNDDLIRRLSSRVANGVRRRLLHDDCIDTGCGLKLFQRSVFLALPPFDHMHRFLAALVRREGGEVLSVPVGHRPRTAGVSKYGLFDRLGAGIIDLLGVMWLQRRPLALPATEDIDETGICDMAGHRLHRAGAVLPAVPRAVAAQRESPAQHRAS